MAPYPAQFPAGFTLLSLCAGVGGLDLGVRLAIPTAESVCYVEREAFAAAVLVARMEDEALAQAPIWTDITTFDGKPWRGRVDCIIGGVPCTPWSVAGKRKGTADARWLWPDMRRIIAEINPKFVFFENVPGIISKGLPIVFADLREMGYEVEGGIFAASEVGAPHVRKRLFLLACIDHPDARRLLANAVRSGVTDADEQGWPAGPSGADAPTVEWRSSPLAYSDGEGRLQCEGLERFIGQRLGDIGAVVADAEGFGEREPDDEAGTESWERSRLDTGGGSGDMADASSVGREQGWPEQQGLIRNAASEQPSGPLGDANGAGREGQHPNDIGPVAAYTEPADAGADVAAAPWPPGPDAAAEWEEYLQVWPGLTPAFAKSDVRRDFDVLASGMDRSRNRIDRLRAVGNGVVSVTAAHALKILAGRFE